MSRLSGQDKNNALDGLKEMWSQSRGTFEHGLRERNGFLVSLFTITAGFLVTVVVDKYVNFLNLDSFSVFGVIIMFLNLLFIPVYLYECITTDIYYSLEREIFMPRFMEICVTTNILRRKIIKNIRNILKLSQLSAIHYLIS